MTTPNSTNHEATIPDVSLQLDHIRHYLILLDQESETLHVHLHDEETKGISNRISWLTKDLLNMLTQVGDTLYPEGRIATTNTQQGA